MKFIKKQSITIIIALNLILLTSGSLLSITEKKSLTSQYNSQTRGNEWGSGNIFYLDRHSVDCGAFKVIQGFHLIRPRGDQIAYEFACGGNRSLVKSNTYTTQTPWNATNRDAKDSTNYLDRHNVQCRQGFALQQFRLIRNGDRIAYQYRCAELANAQQCVSNLTSKTYGNTTYLNIFLDRQRIFVGADRAMTHFKLNTNYRGSAVYYRYSYASCKMGAARAPNKPARSRRVRRRPAKRASNQSNRALGTIPVFNRQTRRNDWGSGNVFYLDRHNVECGNGFLMQGFHLKRPTSHTISYEYACMKNVGSNNPNDSYTRNTLWNRTARNSISSTNYLDRHSVACKPGHALQQFKMIRKNNKIAYNYRCAKANVSDCRGETTKESNGHKVYKNIYLDRQRVLTRAGRALTQFKLNSRYSRGRVFYHYSFTTCKVRPANSNRNKRHLRRNNNNPRRKKGNKHKSSRRPSRRRRYVNKRNGNKRKPFRYNRKPIRNKPRNSRRRNNSSSRHKLPKKINYDKYFPVKDLVGKPRNFVPPAHIKPKRITRGNRQLVQEGNNFCNSFCAPNPDAREKICWKNGIKSCFSCGSKHKDAGVNKDADELCSRVCNSIEKSDTCAFYAYINENKKIVNKNLLSKFGLSSFIKYLKRFI